jgi:hypothetical protein
MNVFYHAHKSSNDSEILNLRAVRKFPFLDLFIIVLLKHLLSMRVIRSVIFDMTSSTHCSKVNYIIMLGIGERKEESKRAHRGAGRV